MLKVAITLQCVPIEDYPKHMAQRTLTHSQNDFNIRDALITPHGKEQCKNLRDAFPFHDEIDIVLASPLRRTIQTAIESFTPALLRPGVRLLLVPQAQEISNKPCDTGFEREELERELEALIEEKSSDGGFDSNKIDYSILEPGWSKKTGNYEASLTAVIARAAELRRWLWQRPEKTIVLVTHGAFLHYFTDDWSDFEPRNGTAYKNCEFRSFVFTDDSSEEEAHLVQVGRSGPKGVRAPGSHANDISGAEK
ncbi:hypothetical protein WAI453_007645 [Rhynchosporium graminicola]|uniref:Phosphoglycerate mutase family protein n=1 Tax=Rhynchosporium graminicola TaxID=2792576 RepID=A0A1E1L5C6_9HELO|nr:uncharacterized protein RCO7_10694 [Rhynchosporium commune]